MPATSFRSPKPACVVLSMLILLSLLPAPAGSVSAAPRRAKPSAAPRAVAPAPVRPAVSTTLVEPSISPEATDTELSRFLATDLPLVPTAPTDPSANRVLAEAAQVYRGSPRCLSALEAFLAGEPASPWRAAVLLRLGVDYREAGFFSKAVDALAESWRLAETLRDTDRIAMANRAGAELAWLLAVLGKRPELEAHLRALRGRTLSSESLDLARRASEVLDEMRRDPAGAARCGVIALDNLLDSQDTSRVTDPRLASATATPRGMSLSALAALASTVGLDLAPVRRESAGDVPLPAIVHWRSDHFAAVLDRRETSGQTQYLVADPVFDGRRWIPATAFDEEGSGYFLVKSGTVTAGWSPVDTSTAAGVWGRGIANSSDPWAYSCGDEKAGEGCGPGMIGYRVQSMLVSLTLSDTPLVYQPVLGGPIGFTLTYNERNGPGAPRPSGLPAGWTHNWFAYVSRPINDPKTYVYLRGGSREEYPNSTGGLHPESGAKVTFANGLYTRELADGSKEVYGPGLTVGSQNQTFYPLNRVQDPMGHGVNVAMEYVQTTNDAPIGLGWRVTSLTDDHTVGSDPGKQVIFNYVEGELRSVQLEAPDSRSCSIAYHPSGEVQTITDALGLVSTIAYAQDGRPQSIQTPYGQTTFTYSPPIWDGQPMSRWIAITDPLGDTERVEYRNFAEGNPWLPWSENVNVVPVPPTGIPAPDNSHLYVHNTFHWDKKQYAEAASNSSSSAVASATMDYSKARITHWLKKDREVLSGWVGSHKQPLENRVWYAYPGQGTGATGFVGTIKKPSWVGRVTRNGVSATSPPVEQEDYVIEYGHPSGRHVPTAMSGPVIATGSLGQVRRTTRFYYSTTGVTNGINLLKVTQDERATVSSAPVEKTLVEYTYGNASFPFAITAFKDAAGQTTQTAYMADGRVDYVTDARGAQTDFIYDDDEGQLTKRLKRILEPQVGSVSSETHILVYDSKDRPQTVSVTGWGQYTVTYDNLDRTTLVTFPDGTTEETIFFDDKKLDVWKTKDRLNRYTEFTVNSLRQLTDIKDAENRIVHLDWCKCGSLAKLRDQNNNTTEWARDLQGRVTQKRYANLSTVDVAYEAETGRVRQVTDRVATGVTRTTSYGYTVDGQVKDIVYAGGPVATPRVDFVYDLSYGRLESVTTGGTSTTSYAYVPITSNPYTLGAGQLMSVDGPSGNDTVSFTYDELGRARTRTVAGGPQEVWTYDAMGRLQIVENALGTFTYTYEGATDRLDKVYYPQAFSTGQTPREDYDYQTAPQTFNLLKSTLRGPVGNAIAQRFDYQTSATGRIDGVSEGVAGDFRTFGYDLTDRLRGVTPPGQQTQIPYNYDPAGNRTQAGTTTTWSYTNVNTINQQTGPARMFAHDLAGNMTDTDTGNVSPTTRKQFEWDVANRLRAIVRPGVQTQSLDELRSELTYDAFSRWTRLVEKTNGVAESDTRYIWSGSEIVAEQSPSDEVTRRFFEQGFLEGARVGGYRLRNTNTAGPADLSFEFGPPDVELTALSGDWDNAPGDGVGLYDGAAGVFYLRNTATPGPADVQFPYGAPGAGWQAIAGDWNGDGTDTIGLYDPSTGVFYLRNTNSEGSADVQFGYGPGGQGWQPIAGDWDGDGDDTIGLYDPSAGVFYLRNSNTDGPADEQFGYGPAGLGWEPVAGDWDGNGTTTVGLYDATTSIYYLRNAHGGGPADLQFQFGPPLDGYAAVAGDWNGDGTSTIGLYRESKAEKKYYYTRDHLGSVRAVWTAAGAQVASYTYDEWGVTTSGINQVESPIGYAGYWRHQRSGLSLTVFRAYSAELGRWINRDPIGELGGINLYAYVGNAPSEYRDPTGLSPMKPD